MDEWKRSGQIPTFGNWDYANDLPITQYFECARQAGLIRYSASSGESESNYMQADDLYAVDFRRHSRNLVPSHPRKTTATRGVRGENRGPHVKELKKQSKQQGKVCDVTEPPRKQHSQQQRHISVSHNSNKYNHNGHGLRDKNGDGFPPNSRTELPVKNPKPVDEDLYKIPPELLHSTKRKKLPGLFSCLVPPCAS